MFLASYLLKYDCIKDLNTETVGNMSAYIQFVYVEANTKDVRKELLIVL